MGASGLWSLVYSSNFEVRQIPGANQHISGNNNPSSIKFAVAWVKIFEKHYQLF